MSRRREFEITYYREQKTTNLIEQITKIAKDMELCISSLKYSCQFGILVEDKNHSKNKLMFRLNDRNLEYRNSTKILRSNGDIMEYEEKVTHWRSINDYDVSEFAHLVRSMYYKEKLTTKVVNVQQKCKLSIENVRPAFALRNSSPLTYSYIEVESDQPFSEEMLGKTDLFKVNHDWKIIDTDHSKILICEDNEQSNFLLSFTDVQSLSKEIIEYFRLASVSNL